MINVADVVLRVFLLVGAFYNLLGYMWGGSDSGATLFEVYAASPWIALAIGALVPNGMLSRVGGKLLFLPVGLLAVIRSVDHLVGDLKLINGPDYLAAVLRLLVIVLLSIVAIKAYFLTKKSTSSE